MINVLNNLAVMDRTFVTGEIPIQAYGILGGREDFSGYALRSLWNGCIDAVEYVPTGQVRVVRIEDSIVPCSRSREFG